MKSRLFLCSTTFLTGLVLHPALAATTASLEELDTLGGLSSGAVAVSSDGSVVAGSSTIDVGGTKRAFRWTGGVMTGLGTLGGAESWTNGMSADGSTVVGASINGVFTEAFRWTGGVMSGLGTLGGDYSSAGAASADGSVIVGEADTVLHQTHAFRWTGGVMTDLGTVGGSNSYAFGVSADGAVVAGASDILGDVSYHAFRWTGGLMTDLGTLGGTTSWGQAVSADGTTVVGASLLDGDTDTRAFRWKSGTNTMENLGTLGDDSWANAVSGDGAIVVGGYQPSGGGDYHAFRWTEADHMKDLNTLLSAAGVDMTGVTLKEASGISANGKYIVGYGDFGAAGDRAYIALYDAPVESGSSSTPVAGVTTPAAQIESAKDIAQSRQTSMSESRATGNELLGMTRPMGMGSFVQSGGLFGSAVGYVGGQVSVDEAWTLLGGLGWGAQDYGQIEQDDALTAAAGVRYTIRDSFLGGKDDPVHPYIEFGAWSTPQETLTFNRTYQNGAATATGRGSSDASTYAAYIRGGLIWSVTPDDKLTGYGEFGKQYLSLSSYDEAYSSSNPFPASMDGGLLFMNVVRSGLQWAHELGKVSFIEGSETPLSLTLAGAGVHSYAVHTSLATTLVGVGTFVSPSSPETWGELGARLSAKVTDGVSLGLDLAGTVAGKPIGNSIHGGASVSFNY